MEPEADENGNKLKIWEQFSGNLFFREKYIKLKLFMRRKFEFQFLSKSTIFGYWRGLELKFSNFHPKYQLRYQYH